MADWIVIYKNTNRNKVEIAKSVLEDNEIKVVLVDKMDSMNKYLMNAEIELHVNAEDAIKAKHIISKNQL